ncbi:MAG: glucosamine--fructose-6-phosphate aminotransferase, partial [Chlamydiota bacterium]
MCGVFGYVGKKDALKTCLQGLEKLEYRGYDSSGIGGVVGGHIALCKKAGKLAELKKALDLTSLNVAIGHTRWATHGAVNDLNAHPHVDAHRSICLIHNGIIENHETLRKELEAEGVRFASDTDSETVAQLLAKYYRGSLIEAMQKTIARLEGIFALLAVHKDHPDEIVAAARACPLSIAVDDAQTEALAASDPNAFFGMALNVSFLHADETALLKQGTVLFYDAAGRPIAKKTEKFQASAHPPSKAGYETFMLKEIHEQPITMRSAMVGRMEFEAFQPLARVAHEIDSVLIFGCGTSMHAGMIAERWIETFASIPARVEIASEGRYRPLLFASPNTWVIAISQSGETADTLAAVREAKSKNARVLAICNVKNSTLTREADHTLLLQAGPEISVCSTKAFTSQITTLALFALFLGLKKKKCSMGLLETYLNELREIPEKIEALFRKEESLKALAKKYHRYDDFFFMGRNYMYPTCLEAALKLKEISYVHANGYPGGELKHGPIALLDPSFPVLAFA